MLFPQIEVNFYKRFASFLQPSFLKSSTPLKDSVNEPVRTQASVQRLSTELSMKSSAEAYLKGSIEVKCYFCKNYVS